MSNPNVTLAPLCTGWCTEHSMSDPACWSADNRVTLTMEESYPDATVAAFAYRQTPAHREVTYLHVYRPSDNEFLDLDASVRLTAEEARQLAQQLLDVAELIGGAGR